MVCLAHEESQDCLRKTLVRLLGQIPGSNQKWSFSFIGPLEQQTNLSVLTFLAEHWPDVGIHLSEMLKDDTQAMTFCEIAFFAPHPLIDKLLLNSELNFGWNLKLCGWLLEMPSQKDLLLEFKRDEDLLFTIPSTNINLGFAASDDWDRIEFFSSSQATLSRIRELALKL